MCGIAGILGLDRSPVKAEELRRMCAAMVHRGPDGEGTYLGPVVGLAMRRLKIIDLATGDQPIGNEDGSVWVVFNGEIYNFRELREELEARGHRFSTKTDTEVIVHLYEDRGPRCVEALRGMFALAVWDERRRTLLLARDRLGIKPLYYGEAGGRLVFASEMKALLQLPAVRREIDWGAFGHLLTFLSTPGTRSILRGVRKLPPGHLLLASPGEPVRVQRYWDLAFEPDRDHDERWFVERLRELLEESVRLHLVSDVPVGAFLSGGVDSSSVVATMAGLTSEPVRTFSIGFGSEDFSELVHARRVAAAFGTDHRELVLEPDVLSIVDELAWHLDEPFGDSSAIPTFMVSKMAAEHVTVVLSGDGGDELFAGYDRYAVEARERLWGLVPDPALRILGRLARGLPEGVRGRNFLRHVTLAAGERYLDAATLFRREDLGGLLRPDVLELLRGYDPWEEAREHLARGGEAAGKRRHWLSSLQYLDVKTYLPLDILTKVDRMSMAHSLEARVPLLDHRLVEFAATIPPEMQLQDGVTKALFKKALRGILPDDIIDRRKQGFAIPLGRWFRGDLEGFARGLLLAPGSRTRGVFDAQAIETLLAPGRRDDGLGLDLWTLLSFELWCRVFLESPPQARAQDRPLYSRAG